MRNLKKYIFIGMTALLATSCSDFLDTAPKDALSPVSTWQTQRRRRQVPRWLLQQLARPVQLRLGLGRFPPVLGWYK